jgi:hypothetical protein
VLLITRAQVPGQNSLDITLAHRRNLGDQSGGNFALSPDCRKMTRMFPIELAN